MEVPVLILGAGFTGSRVARILRETGRAVVTTSGRPATFDEWRTLPSRSVVLYSVPPDEWEAERFGMLAARSVARVVYLSSTGVYGRSQDVNEHTAIAPRTERELRRAGAEQRVMSGPWQAMVLRPSAIYGPGRGAHQSIREGRFHLWGDGSNYVSRIHVSDLAALCVAALRTGDGGAWPVGDEEPCRSIEVVRFCCDLLRLPIPSSAPDHQLSETRRANRRVDGRAVCRLLNVKLRYPSYRTGIPACLSEERLLASHHRPE